MGFIKMARKKCKRKVWQLVNPISMAIMGAAISGERPLNILRLAELSAIDSLTKGTGTPEDFRWVCDCLNIAETMCHMGIGRDEVLPLCKQAQDALLEAKARHDNVGRLALTGKGIKAVKELWQYHDVQRTSVARSVYETAIKKTADKIRSRASDVVEIA
jgi:hypothetical protein